MTRNLGGITCCKNRSGNYNEITNFWLIPFTIIYQLIKCALIGRRREEIFNSFRDFRDILERNDEEDDFFEEDMDYCSVKVEDKQEKPKCDKLRDLFMLSEWMTELPVDFRDNWLMKLCPVGKRCLVRSCKVWQCFSSQFSLITRYQKLPFVCIYYKACLTTI